ncbi:LysR family transcriptional regulator, partial [Amylibacter sp.]|nr:LysR family transcriptional regulator [Amylibacter sp.]
MSISLFKTLIAISETGSFSGASQKVFVTHAAVGQQMRRLEELLSVDLFDRTEKTPRLNQLGNALIPKAKAIVFSYETILDDLTGDPQMIGELTLGAVPSTIRGLIPMAVKRLINTYPNLHIKVVPGISSKLLDQVESGNLDAAVISEPIRIPTNFNWMPIIKEELTLLTAPEITEKNPIKILTSAPYIRHTRQASVGQLADEWLFINNVIVKDSMEMESLENIASMVAHNLGVS